MNKSLCFFKFSFAFSLAILCAGLLISINAAFAANIVKLPKEQEQELTQAIMGNDLGYIKKMVKKDPAAIYNIYTTGTLLAEAVIYRQADIVRYLLEQGADPNQAGIFRKTPMDHAAFQGDIEIARLLIKHGAHVDSGRVPGDAMETPYITAAREHNAEMCKFLIKNKADGSYVTKAGVNALFMAVWEANYRTRTNINFLRFLFENGSDPNVIADKDTPYAATALFCASVRKRQDLYDFLISVGADPNFKDYYGGTPADYMSGKMEPFDECRTAPK